jgi:hypothetical protein
VDVNVEGGAYCLSWTGRAQARLGVSGAAPSGAFAPSPITVAGAAAGQPITVEFNAGTLGRAQLEAGPAATPFERRSLAEELRLCQRYFAKTFAPAAAPAQNAGFDGSLFTYAILANAIPAVRWQLPVQMRAAPAMTYFNPAAANAQWSTGGVNAGTASAPAPTADSVVIVATGPTIAAGSFTAIHATASAEL